MKPEFASIETTLRCNMTCRHCGVMSGPHSTRGLELDADEMLTLMDDLVDLGVLRLIISGGEFTTRRDWQKLLRCALERFGMIRQISNGWLGIRLLDILGAMPRKEKLVLSLSLDGLEDSHDYNRRNGSFQKVIEILGARSDVYRTVITTATTDNFDDLEGIFLLLRSLKVPVWSLQIGLPAGYMEMSRFIGRERIDRLADMIFDWQERSLGEMEIIPDNCFGYDHPMRRQAPWHGCRAGKDLITILANGDVTGCPTTHEEILGNIREQSLTDIWRGPKMEDYRGAIPRCSACSNERCGGGCRAVQKIFSRQFCAALPETT